MAEQQNDKPHNIPEWWMKVVRAAPPDALVGLMALAREALQSVAIAYVHQVREARVAWCCTNTMARPIEVPPFLAYGEMRLDDKNLLMVDGGWVWTGRVDGNSACGPRELVDEEVVHMIMQAQVIWLPRLWSSRGQRAETGSSTP